MLLWKEWRETFPLLVLSLLAVIGISQIKWEGWRPEYFEPQYWIVALLCLPFITLYSGAGAVAGEREERTIEFLFARPAGLFRVLTIKYALRLAFLVFLLAFLLMIFQVLRPTHNLHLYDVLKGVVILFAFLLYALSISFCFSCFTDTPAKAFVSSLMFLYGTLFLINATPFFRYAWLWHNSIDELWLDYLWFYGFLSLIALGASTILMSKNAVVGYQWKHVGIVAVVFFLLFVRSVSTTFWLIPRIALSADMELVKLARQPVEDILIFIAREGKNRSAILRHYLESSSDLGIDRELIKALRHPDPRVRNESVKILSFRQSKIARDAVVQLLRDPDEQVRHSAMDYLQYLKAPEAVPKLIELLNDPSSSIRERAIRVLAATGGKAAAPHFVPMLKDRNPRVCVAAASRICMLDYGDARPEVEKLLREHPVAYVRAEVAASLANMKSTPACAALIQTLLDADRRTSGYAVDSLGELGCDEAVRPLLEVISDNPAEQLRAIAALGKIGGPEAKRGLDEIFSLSDLPPIPKIEIAFALAQMGDEEALQYLRDQMRDFSEKKSNYFMQAYIGRLARMGEYCTVPLLISYMDRGFPSERNSYGQVLTELTGKHYGWDAPRWKKWWEQNKETLLQQKSLRE